MFAPISKQTVVENIINTILEMIAKGEIRPGSSLPSERELACRLNVSRSSLREALKALAYEGIVEIRQGSGTYLTDKAVTTTAPFFSNAEQLLRQHCSDYDQILETRYILETEMVALTAVRIDDAGINELRASIGRMKELLDACSYEAYTMEDLSFHHSIAKNCRNSYLYSAYNMLFPTIVDISKLGETVPDRHWPSYQQHIGLFEAISARDAELAKKRMAEHVHYCGENVALFYSSVALESAPTGK